MFPLSLRHGMSPIQLDYILYNYLLQILLYAPNSSRESFLSCTRLISKNKPDKFMVLMPDLVSLFPNCKWVIIGEGNQRLLLEELIEKLDLERNVILLGSIYTEAELAPWFLSAKFCLHPEAIGLSLLHSFGYGLPVLTHNNADFHGPEFAVIQDGVNSITYNYGDMASGLS